MIEQVINIKSLTSKRLMWPLGVLCSVLVLVALYLAFVGAPPEVEMGAVQRIFYFHVGAAFASYLMIALLLVGSAFYLVNNKSEWDLVAHSGAGVALLFCSIVLLSGMIWGHSAWNTWWSWEPRLVSSLILWLILLAYCFLRMFAQGEQREARLAAVLGVVSAVVVPIVIFSVRFMQQVGTLHPQVVGKQGLKDPAFVWALLAGIAALCMVSFWLFIARTVNLLLQRQLLSLQRRSSLTGEKGIAARG